MKFTEEQLMKVVSAHEGRQLINEGAGYDNPECVCVMQAAFGYDENFWIATNRLKDNNFWALVNWFDINYDPKWTTEQFLAQLREVGLA